MEQVWSMLWEMKELGKSSTKEFSKCPRGFCLWKVLLSQGGGNGRREVKTDSEWAERVAMIVCRLRWEGNPAGSRLAWRTVRLQRAVTWCVVRWHAIPGNNMLSLRFDFIDWCRALLYSLLLLISNRIQCLYISQYVPGTVLSALLISTHLTPLMTQWNRDHYSKGVTKKFHSYKGLYWSAFIGFAVVPSLHNKHHFCSCFMSAGTLLRVCYFSSLLS